MFEFLAWGIIGFWLVMTGLVLMLFLGVLESLTKLIKRAWRRG